VDDWSLSEGVDIVLEQEEGDVKKAEEEVDIEEWSGTKNIDHDESGLHNSLPFVLDGDAQDDNATVMTCVVFSTLEDAPYSLLRLVSLPQRTLFSVCFPSLVVSLSSADDKQLLNLGIVVIDTARSDKARGAGQWDSL